MCTNFYRKEMKKLLYITNIPAPYRQKRFNLMHEIFPKYGIDFEVLYMAKIEPNRKWIIPEESYNYKYKIYGGIHPTVGRFFAHFNPGLLIRLLKNDYDIVIIGGMASPTHWLTPFFVRGKKIQVMSIESNLNSVERRTGLGAMIKKKILQRSNAYQVTGNPQIEYIKFFYPEAGKKNFIKLPNLIDEEVFLNDVENLRKDKEVLREYFNVSFDEQMWVLPARLIHIKGIIPFIKLLEGIENIKLFILGDGELEEEIKQIIKSKNLPIILAGFVQQGEVVKYYAAADLFVLPSLKDPSPLTPIEACASGLPLLVSKRIGNLEDVLEENINGWSYDPIDEIEKGKNIIDIISKLGREELDKRGKSSLKIYNAKFDNRVCIENYAIRLRSLLLG